MDFTAEFESPSSFWRWSAYSVIAAVLRDNVFLSGQAAGDSCYPNLFSILVAASGERKDPPVSLAAKLVTKMGNTKVIEGRSSIEAIIDELHYNETNHQGAIAAKDGSCFLAAPELASFFVNSDSLVPLLTDMYTFREEYTSRLVTRAKHKVKRLCVTLFGASNEILLRQIYNQYAMQGGLLARTLLIRPDEKRPPNSLFIATDDQPKEDFSERQEKDLLSKLSQAAKFKGKPTITRIAAQKYDRWYRGIYTSNHRIDPSGILNRIPAAVKKLAIILAVNSETFTIGEHEIEEAIEQCSRLLTNYQGFTMASGNSTIQEAGTVFLTDLWHAEEHKLTRRDFLSAHWGVVDAELLNKLVETFEQSGFISIRIDGSTVTYTATKKCLEMLAKGNAK